MSDFAVELRDVVKTFKTPEGTFLNAVNHVSMQIAHGEFFSMLGSSGCGKTTSLRMVAGFEWPTGGEVYIEGNAQGHTPPFKRPVNTVFQSYALFQHMTVSQNVAFGLEMDRASKDEIKTRVGRALEMVQLTGMDRRYPRQLSGGQQQRVALARAIVKTPNVLLLDEPLGALDLKLRKEMQLELKALQQKLGITFIYVTHDQEEALTMSDRIAVMSQGQVLQMGSPVEIYERPGEVSVGQTVAVSIRPEKIRLAEKATLNQNCFEGEIELVTYIGSDTHLHVLINGLRMKVWEQNKISSLDPAAYYTVGQKVWLTLFPDNTLVMANE